MSAAADDTSVQVALRIRPQSAAEKIDMCHVCTSVTPDHPQVILGKDKAFTYDHVFDIESVQPKIYDAIARPLIEGCFEGYNATILAYGQTGSGKTYTMGTSFDVGIPDDVIGIIPRAAQHLFEGIKARREEAENNGKPLPEIKVTAQFLELYNEDIVDLLDIEMKGKKNIRVHEDHDGNIYLTGVACKSVATAQDCMNLLEEGAISRTTASTNMNATSSRSHAIFTLFVKHHRLAPSDGDGEEGEEFEVLNAKFNFVDLAGSERLKRTGATGDRAREGISINQGLLSLGNVISALGDKTKRGSHVPYRDSKLTRLLQDSLGGNSRTLMIACVSPSDRDFMETLNTLKYANRARNIKNKVMVNQDKASKQIALLRQEIQQLSIQLTEYKSGKRVADNDGEHMTDTFHELEMLRNENETLRMRAKALQKNIDSQNIQLTELKVTSALACVTSEDKMAVEDMVKKYETEIQKLSNKLMESEAMSSVAVRRAQTVSRMAMSPGTIHEDEEFLSVLSEAKQELRKEKKLKKKLKRKKKPDTDEEEKGPGENENEHVNNSDDTAMADDGKNTTDTVDELEDMIEDDAVDEMDDEEEGDGEDDDDDELLQSNTDSSDSADELNQSLKDEEVLQDDINNLNTDITIKQKLIDELEHSQQRLTALKQQYEQKLSLMHNKIKETEVERDKVLKNIGSVDAVAKEKSNEVRKQYEKKLSTMQKELSKLQNAKREHQRLLKTKDQNEQQLKLLRNEMNDMKKMKVKLMRQMRDEVARNKKMENKLNQQMESILKDSRKKEVQLKRMKDEKKQRDLVLKRKQEELNAMRKQAKPVSGNVTSRRAGNIRPNNLQPQFQQSSQHMNDTFVVDNNTNSSVHTNSSVRQNITTPPNKRTIPTSTRANVRSPAVSKKAKQKWELIERKITELTIRMKNVAQMENDMERWLTDREKISKQLETVRKRKVMLESGGSSSQDENLSKELQNQLEGLEAHMEYIQENITESQGTIMGLEEEGEGINTVEVIQGCSLTETKYLLEHFYGKSIETAQELANKDAAYKEIQIKLEAMEQHCEVQQQLLQHACNLEYGAGYMNIEEETQGGQEAITEDFNNVPTWRKTRRKTALPEELLHPKDRPKNSRSPEPIVLEVNSDDDTGKSVSDNNNQNTVAATNKKEDDGESKSKLQETFQIDEKTMQKLMNLEKSLRDRKAMPPPSVPSNNKTETQPRPRSGSFSNESTESVGNLSLPGNFQRNTRLVKSARNYGKSTSGSHLRSSSSLKKPSSVKASPLLERKLSGDLVSSGKILPAKTSPGKPEFLNCTHTATGHSNAVLSLDVNENLMITGSKDRTAKIWDLNTSEEIMSLSQHKRDVSVVKFFPTNRLAITVYQSTIKLWDLRQGTVVKTLSSSLLQSIGDSSVADIGINRTGTVLYAAFGNFVKMIDLKTYSTLGKLTGHTGAVTCLLVADTGHHHDNIITGSKDHSIKIFEIVDEVPGSQMPRQNLEPPHYDGIESLAMRGDIIYSGSRDNTIKKWNYKNHALEHHITSAHKDWVTALNFIPGYDVLASADRRGIIRLWDVNSCKMLGDIPAHGKAINAIKCDGTTVFTASSDRLVRIWKPAEALESHTSGDLAS